ncbi:MAG: hypothetical protein AMJ65_18775 [Phycisphaerae bacterium SG8_4]|nr:MAG: hypothetical protein AMJ65_18775 [Phycisphaerae bacterium SG8_4]
MVKKMTCLVTLVLLLVQFETASAQTMWSDSGPDHLWSTAENWSPQSVPTNMDPASIDSPDNTHCEIQDGIEAECETLRVGNSSFTANLDISGGSLTAAGAYVGVDNGIGHGVLNISGGLFSTGSLQVGWRGIGTVNMTGGTIELNDNLVVPGLTGTGEVNLNGGTIFASELRLTSDSGSLDITKGTLILDGNDLEVIQTNIDNGRLTAYGGQGSVDADYDVTNPGKTTVTATPLLKPNPVDGGSLSPGQVELSWTLPDPLMPGMPVSVDVYFTDDLQALTQFTDPAAIRIITNQSVSSVSVQTEPKTRYYWAVDVYYAEGALPVYGPIFSFFTDNQPPSVQLEKDLVTTWLTDGAVDVSLDATVTDDSSGLYTVTWTVVSQPVGATAVFSDSGAEDTVVSLGATGQYILQLEADDGEYTGSHTVTIDVYADGCEAAKSLPGFQLIPGDLNEDCVVNELDLAILEAHWLESNKLE